DRDLRAHAPGRVREGFVRGDGGELVAGAAAERAAARGDDEAVDLLSLAPLQALERGRVLAVNGEEPAAAARPCGKGEVACGHEALLVGEREVDAVLEGPDRGRQAGEAHDGVEDAFRLRPPQQLDEAAAPRLERRVDAVERARPRRGGAQLELGMARDDVERLTADRAGGAEEGYALHAPSVGT